MLIVLEGLDGVGKGLAAELIKSHLEEIGAAHDVVITSIVTERSLSLNTIVEQVVKSSDPATPLAEYLMINAAAIELLDRLVVPSLNNGKTVILDRFIDSAWVYQGTLHKINPYIITFFTRLLLSKARPAATIIIDSTFKGSYDRINSRNAVAQTQYDALDVKCRSRMRRAYLSTYEIKRKNPIKHGAYYLVKNNGTKEALANQLKKICSEIYK